ncbi:MAG: hypothetical protein ABW221_15580 [Vicinamibacteria bacterium]
MLEKTTTLTAVALAVVFGTARADEWDVASVGDGGTATRNVLFHGSEQVHDLAAVGPLGDEDWYVVATRGFSSYQVVIDGMTGDLDLAPADVQLLDTTGTAVQASALLGDFGGTLTLAWSNGSAPPAVRQFVRVRDAACGTACTNPDRYRVRFYDTTYTIPRFNNSGTQATVVTVQNATEQACDLTYAFLNGTGGLAALVQHTVPARGLDVFATASAVPGQSGSLRIAHTCGYGGLSGKAVSIEPSTGFTFDTQMIHRPH